MDSHLLTARVKAEAHRLGFSLVGVTTPDPPPHLEVYFDWLAAGRHGEMSYLAADRARQARADPRRLLPECRSILSLGIFYPFHMSNIGEHVKGIKISSYAWGEDYHDVLPARMRTLVAYIETLVGANVPNRYYTDAGPLLERDLAQHAGLGWIGKNTCLINPRLGSTFFLAEILLGIELEPDLPFTADHCGSCTRCIDACPTACILPDRTLDARRCISYLTIELKGAIPAELRPLIGNWVFGCDICQQVCPWNQRFAPRTGDPAFARAALELTDAPTTHGALPGVPLPSPASDLPAGISTPSGLDPLVELALNPAAFNRKYKHSPLRRAKRRGYLRNLAVAIGNLHAGVADPALIAALAAALTHDSEPLVRDHIAWALDRIGGDAARRAPAEMMNATKQNE